MHFCQYLASGVKPHNPKSRGVMPEAKNWKRAEKASGLFMQEPSEEY